MEQAGANRVIATSKPNVQYLLGGYRFHFYEHANAIGQSRYLPIFRIHAACQTKPPMTATRSRRRSLRFSRFGWLPFGLPPPVRSMPCSRRFRL
jgi:hypothetical protein